MTHLSVVIKCFNRAEYDQLFSRLVRKEVMLIKNNCSMVVAFVCIWNMCVYRAVTMTYRTFKINLHGQKSGSGWRMWSMRYKQINRGRAESDERVDYTLEWRIMFPKGDRWLVILIQSAILIHIWKCGPDTSENFLLYLAERNLVAK